jgi:hypothetical protein
MAVQCFAGGGLGISGVLCVPVRSLFFNLTGDKDENKKCKSVFI